MIDFTTRYAEEKGPAFLRAGCKVIAYMGDVQMDESCLVGVHWVYSYNVESVLVVLAQ
jgi:hypothetical protein